MIGDWRAKGEVRCALVLHILLNANGNRKVAHYAKIWVIGSMAASGVAT